jgi:hypothetical protein
VNPRALAISLAVRWSLATLMTRRFSLSSTNMAVAVMISRWPSASVLMKVTGQGSQ